MTFGRLGTFAILIWVFFYTASYAKWTWKSKNKLGGVMLFVLALVVIALPVYSIYFLQR